MIRRPISRTSHVFLGITSIVLLLGVYEYMSYRQHIRHPQNTTMPSLVKMAKATYEISTPDPISKKIVLWEDAKASAKRYFLGLSVGVAISIVLGTLMGCYPLIEGFFLTPLSVAAKIPPTATLAIFMILAGTDMGLFVVLIGFGTAPILTQAIYQATKYDIHDELVDKSYTLGGSDAEIIIEIIMRQTLPRMLEAIRLQMGPALVYLIAAEFLLADVGFGYTLNLESRKQNMAIVYPICLLLGLIGLTQDYAVRRLRQWLSPWFEKVV